MILITHTLNGHRSNWLTNIVDILEERGYGSLSIITIEEKLNIQVPQSVSITYTSSKNEALKLAKSVYALDNKIRFLILDGEFWLKQLFLSGLPINVLFLRPFMSRLSFKSAIVFFVKRFTILLLSFKKNIQYRFLSVPFYQPLFLKDKWVQDDLTTYDIERFNFVKQSKKKFIKILIPGFISNRKNPLLVLEIARYLEFKSPGKHIFLFMGQIDSATREILDSSNLANLQYTDQYLDRLSYLKCINNADYVMLLYKNRGASGILLESLSLNTPILLKRDRIWSNLIANYQNTIIPVEDNKDDITSLLLNSRLPCSRCMNFELLHMKQRDNVSLVAFICSL